jgi:GTP cyclohydrolase III
MALNRLMVERNKNVTLNIGAASSDDESEDSASTCLQNEGSATDSPYEKIDSSTNSADEGPEGSSVFCVRDIL